MTLRQRFSEILKIITQNIPEREYYVQLGFLTALVHEPFYLYGRPGCGSSLMIRRIASAFKDAKIQKIDKKQKQLPENLNDFNLIVFDNFTPGDEQSKSNLQIAIHDRANVSIIISGDQKPESVLSRSEVSDQVTLTIMLPENISPEALCKLIQIHTGNSNVTVPPEIAISAEEQAQWLKNISKVTLSPDTLDVIGKVAEICARTAYMYPSADGSHYRTWSRQSRSSTAERRRNSSTPSSSGHPSGAAVCLIPQFREATATFS